MRGACRWTNWLYYLLPLTCGVAKCTGDGELTIVEGRSRTGRSAQCSAYAGHAGQCACHPRSRVPRRTNALKSASNVSCRSMCRAVCLCVVQCYVSGLRSAVGLYLVQASRDARAEARAEAPSPRLSLGSAVHPVAVLPFSVFVLFVFRSVVSIPCPELETRVRNWPGVWDPSCTLLAPRSRSPTAARWGPDRADRTDDGAEGCCRVLYSVEPL